MDNKIEFGLGYIEELVRCLRRIDMPAVAAVMQVLEKAWEQQQVFIVGNGGSAATASHMGIDLLKTVKDRAPDVPGFRAMPLTDNVPIITALANDLSYGDIFVQPLRTFARPGDVLIAISGSGNSANIIRAVQVAREMGLTTVGFLGRGGKLKDLVHLAVLVDSDDYGPVEDVHMVLDHLLTAYFKQWLAAKAG